MAITTYSFSDSSFVISPVGQAAYTVNGTGVGRVSIAYTNPNSSHNNAADGSVAVTKIKADNGTVSFSVQQSSPLHAYLMGVFNVLNAGPSNLWAGTTITVDSLLNIADNHTLKGCSFEKRAGRGYEQQAKDVVWTFLFAEGHSQGLGLPSLNVQGNIL